MQEIALHMLQWQIPSALNVGTKAGIKGASVVKGYLEQLAQRRRGVELTFQIARTRDPWCQ